jgi:iron-sulfur cluster assembly accessory protein
MIQISNEAAKELKELLEKEGKLNFGLRISYAGNGCSGPQYSLSLDEKPSKDEEVQESNGVKMFMNTDTEKTLDGAEIDFVNDPLFGKGFTIKHPNLFGCGSCGGGSCG